MLQLRARLLRRVRAFFDDRGFCEVETPYLSHETVIDRHLDPFETAWIADPRRPERQSKLYLQTSPEFGMKRLLVTGAGPIYQIARAFRNGECGPLHNPEFTLVEWYRPGDDYAAGMALLSDFAEALLERGPADRVTYAEVFARALQVDPHTAAWTVLRDAAIKHQLVPPESLATDRDGWLDFLLTELIQPTLGRERPLILHDYPANQAALAQIRPSGFPRANNPPVAERFELHYQGIELANGYHELLAADVLRERNAAQNALRVADGKSPLPEESLLLAAMEAGLPACSGCALGFDRLVLLAVGAKTLAEVLPFPGERA